MKKIEVSLEEIGLAYRRAKVDLFFASRNCRDDLLKFEQELATNLRSLEGKIEARAPFDFDNDDWSVLPHGFAEELEINTISTVIIR